MWEKRLFTVSKYLLRQSSFKNNVILKNSFSTQSRILNAKSSYLHHIGKHPLIYRNVGQELERAAVDYKSTEAFVSYHENKRHTFDTLLYEADRLAAGFLKLGLKKGDYLGVWGPNTLQWYLTMLGAARAGLISVCLNPAFQAPEVEYCLKKVNIRAIVAPETFKTQNYYEILKTICPELSHAEIGKINSKNLPNLKAVIIDTDIKLKGAISFNDVLSLCSKDDVNDIIKLQSCINPDSACNVQFTSGTTGNPKAAVLSHFNIVNNGLHIGSRNQLANERICVQNPFFHVYGIVITIMAALTNGATLVIPSPGFSPEASLKAIVAEKCTVIHGTPTMYVDLIHKQRELQLPLKTAKRAITGGAPCAPQLILDIKNILGVEDVRTVYGLTETTSVVFQSLPGDSKEHILNTVGHLLDHIEAKVIDADGNTVPFGEPGELCVRGYSTMLGYYGDEAKTRETMTDGNWLRTGDQFVLQEDGYGRIVGRLKDIIIRGGENIFPKEVEDFLNTHPQIIEAHVIGVQDDRMGEEICAFVRLHDGASISRQMLKDFAKGKLSHFKVPRFIMTVEDFPKTASGKIQKFKLLETFKNKSM